MQSRYRRWIAALAFVAAGPLVAAGCGARTDLDLADPCGDAGAERACAGPCGVGQELCNKGYWQPCEVPIATRACSGVCGAGSEQCQDGKWGSCVIPVAMRVCENDCGAGMEQCQNEVWQGCVVPVAQRDCSSQCGAGHETCSAGSWGPCDAPQPKPPVLHTTVRDFHKTQPDFELPLVGDWLDPDIVQSTLGADHLPVYKGDPPALTTVTTDGRANFDVWYRDTPGVNLSKPLDLQLAPDPETAGLFVYDNRMFFVIDNELFGNEGLPHNYHFTVESHTAFVYRGGETFSFAGDDDMWVFINNQLAINLGGIHKSLTRDVALDGIAAEFGLVVGTKYPLDFFFAERHTFGSDFTVRTTIADEGSCQ